MVGVHDRATAGSSRVYQAHRGRRDAIGEQPLAAAQDRRETIKRYASMRSLADATASAAELTSDVLPVGASSIDELLAEARGGLEMP